MCSLCKGFNRGYCFFLPYFKKLEQGILAVPLWQHHFTYLASSYTLLLLCSKAGFSPGWIQAHQQMAIIFYSSRVPIFCLYIYFQPQLSYCDCAFYILWGDSFSLRFSGMWFSDFRTFWLNLAHTLSMAFSGLSGLMANHFMHAL